MNVFTATASAFPNIAYIKYWGDRDSSLHLPANSSLSMNLAGLVTQVRMSFSAEFANDELIINTQPAQPQALARVSAHLDFVRQLAGVQSFARVVSSSNFPAGAGLASSASAFAALTLAACQALGLSISEPELSAAARLGSGSACRSIPGGFVEWRAGHDHASSYAFSIAPAVHWPLADCIALVSADPKQTSSIEGHRLAATSPLQPARLQDADRRLSQCRAAILGQDFAALAQVVELDCYLMHAVMLTSTPSLLYWAPATVEIIHQVRKWRADGLEVCATIDAGPNVHVLCPAEISAKVSELLQQIPGVLSTLCALPGGAAWLEED